MLSHQISFEKTFLSGTSFYKIMLPNFIANQEAILHFAKTSGIVSDNK